MATSGSNSIGTFAVKLLKRVGMHGLRKDLRALERTGIFDSSYYLSRYPDVAEAGTDPRIHYLDSGAAEGRCPAPFFDGGYYLKSNPDVAASGQNPLIHFAERGWRESRHPSPHFDIDWYRQTHLSAEERDVNPLLHYLSQGLARGLEIRAVSNPLVELLEASGLFDERYYLAEYPDVLESGEDAISHYLRHGAREGRNPSELFHTRYYLQNNPDVSRSRVNPLVHFARTGWQELRNPSPTFDVWWYCSNHMGGSAEGENPLAHYYRVGREAGLSTKPPDRPLQLPGAGHRIESGTPPRRVCLFAGYDCHGIVDDYVIRYLSELSRHCDVYYMADCDMQSGELEKIAPYVVEAWAERHGCYDFGSYSRLVEKVGWERIEGYDELLLVNDSCYLLTELDRVFSEMDTRACDWWGMQCTKGLSFTRRKPSNRFRQPIPLEAVKGSLLGAFESEYTYDFHVGSYFVAYRKPVIADPHFRNLLASVRAETSKRTLILKYEVGLTRHLIARGHVFDTFIDALYPFHPVFTGWYFQLLEQGFPLLKRYLLSENHYSVPRLCDWAERIEEKVPGVDTAMIRRNLERVTDPEKLHRNLNLGTDRLVEDLPIPLEPLNAEQFRAADRLTPKYRSWWAFPVCAFSTVFSGNERALFEEVKNDPRIRKIVLTRGTPVAVDGVNVDVFPLESAEGQYHLLRAGNVFIKHSPTRNLVYPVSGDLHNIINLWHGIPFKRIGYASADMQHRLGRIASEHARCRAVISSSKVDTLAMAASFYPLSVGEVWNTGLPRNDFIVRERSRLPDDLQEEFARVEGLLAGRRLVLFMPTFRNEQEGACYRFGPDEIAFLDAWLKRNNAVMGVREHMADSARVYGRQLEELACLDLGDRNFPNVEVLYRASSALITDYSSCFIDYMLTGKPAVSFAYDYDRYLGMERGAFYDLEFVFPGRVCRSFGQLRSALEQLFEDRTDVELAALEWKRKLFFDHVDDRNSARVAEQVKRLTDLEAVGRPLLGGEV